jgi:hypothetical protein
MMGRRKTLVAASLVLLAVGIVALAWSAAGPVVMIVPAMAGSLYGAARLDNHTGSCLMVAILGWIVLGVLAMALIGMAMLAIHHA